MQIPGCLALTLLVAVSALGQSVNQITVVSPTNAAQGTTLTVTFTLDTDAPPAPPAGAPVTSVTLGAISGSSVTHTNQYLVTARFSISASEPVGWQDAAIVFSTPNGTLTFSKSSAFQVTAGSGVAAGFTATPTYGTPPLTVTFTNTSTGTITNQLWNFGDGVTSTNLNPTHTYSNAVSYTVSLTVFGAAGSNTLTRASYITVTTNLGAYLVVDTGQTKCYDTNSVITAPSSGQPYYGQDAQFSGNQPSYTLSGDGKTVHDNITGLTWMRGPNLTLTAPVKADKMTYAAATNWPTTVNAASYGGYSDWRLPTIKELYSLFDCRGTDPSSYSGSDLSVLTPFIDTHYFLFAYGQTNLGERVIDSQYASSTTFILNPSENGYQKDFGVNFADGRIKGYDLSMPDNSDKTFFVQLVRGGTSYGYNLFTNNGDGTITDLATGLMWSRNDNGSALLWSNALAWVQGRNASNYLGHSDWRLPNIKELQSIINYDNAPDYNGLPAMDTNYFICTVITNEGGNLDYPYYWSGSTHAAYSAGNTGGGEADYIPFGRALGYSTTLGKWVDVHGAGCQRSDPKVGPPYSYATTHTVTTNGATYTGYAWGPQGDAIRGLNFVRLVRGGNHSSVDHVGDGIPDWWRALYFGGDGTTTNAASCATCNPDGDSFNNWQEYLADTNPTNAPSCFHIHRISISTNVAAFYQSSASRKYTLYYATNLTSGAWTNIPSQTDISGSGGVDALSDSSPADTQRFYRIGVRVP
jgi:PKD repeat protein